MRQSILEVRNYETYYLVDIISNVLRSPYDYIVRLHDFYGEGEVAHLLTPFQKYSAFHHFIEFIVRDHITEQLQCINLDDVRKDLANSKDVLGVLYEPDELRKEELKSMELPIESAFRYHQIPHESFLEWLSYQEKGFDEATEDDVSEYYLYLELSEQYATLVNRMVEEIFFILFANRESLACFHILIANAVAGLAFDQLDVEYKAWFERPGRLRRVEVPAWAKKAVFFRDRGRCVLCNVDVSNLLSLQSIGNFDHIVPLAQGGINDITNLQLLCADCNSTKGGELVETSNRYEKWY